jgi:hypothetical protein
MGRRSRNRPAPAPRSAPQRPSRLDRFVEAGEQRPKAPWHPFPLVELCVLLGIVLIVFGLIRSDQESGRIMLLAGLVLASLAGLDTAAREHFAGFRSHSSLLAGVPAVLAAGVMFFSRLPWPVLLAVTIVVFVAAFAWFRAAFRRRSGGRSFR